MTGFEAVWGVNRKTLTLLLCRISMKLGDFWQTLMKKYKVDTNFQNENRFIFSGLLGISVVAIIQFLQLSALDTPLTVSLYSFSVAVPLLTLSVFTITVTSHLEYTVVPGYLVMTHTIGTFAAFTGTVCIFWHFSRIAGIVFLLMSLIATVIYSWFDVALTKANKKEANNQPS